MSDKALSPATLELTQSRNPAAYSRSILPWRTFSKPWPISRQQDSRNPAAYSTSILPRLPPSGCNRFWRMEQKSRNPAAYSRSILPKTLEGYLEYLLWEFVAIPPPTPGRFSPGTATHFLRSTSRPCLIQVAIPPPTPGRFSRKSPTWSVIADVVGDIAKGRNPAAYSRSILPFMTTRSSPAPSPWWPVAIPPPTPGRFSPNAPRGQKENAMDEYKSRNPAAYSRSILP